MKIEYMAMISEILSYVTVKNALNDVADDVAAPLSHEIFQILSSWPIISHTMGSGGGPGELVAPVPRGFRLEIGERLLTRYLQVVPYYLSLFLFNTGFCLHSSVWKGNTCRALGCPRSDRLSYWW